MDYTKLVAVTGLPGLYELISSKTDGAIVRSLDDKTTRFISGRVHNFSHLESIEVFTQRENVNLAEVFHAMEKSKEKFPDEKDAGAVRKYFQAVFPDMDFEKVYDSDRKKMLKWFEVLKNNNIEIKLPEPAAEEVKEEPVTEEKPAKKTEKKKEEAKKPAEEKSVKKKTTPKKK
jgi:hypothetical protein